MGDYDDGKEKYIDYYDYLDYEGVEDGNGMSFEYERREYDRNDYEHDDYDYDRYEQHERHGPGPVDKDAHGVEPVDEVPKDGNVMAKHIDVKSWLCKDHGLKMLSSCPKCAAVKVVIDEETLQSLGARESSEDVIPDTVSWIDQDVADKKVTLKLPAAAINYGEVVYFRAPQPKGTFEGWVRDFLFLALSQNEKLMKNLQVEKILIQFGGHRDFQNILRDVRNLLVKGLKNNRIAHRPLLMAVAKLDEIDRAMREEGSKHGMKFPKEPPSKSLFGPRV